MTAPPPYCATASYNLENIFKKANLRIVEMRLRLCFIILTNTFPSLLQKVSHIYIKFINSIVHNILFSCCQINYITFKKELYSRQIFFYFLQAFFEITS